MNKITVGNKEFEWVSNDDEVTIFRIDEDVKTCIYAGIFYSEINEYSIRETIEEILWDDTTTIR